MSLAAGRPAQQGWLLVLLALCSQWAALAQTNEFITLTGTLLISNVEYPNEVHVRSVFLKTADASVYRVELADPDLVERQELFSGQEANVTGLLDSSRASAGHPPSIHVESAAGGAIVPLVTRERVPPRVDVVHDPTVRIDGLETNLGLPVSQHQPLMTKFKMLFIPIMAVDANGNTCPGTQPITYTKQDIENVMWGAADHTLVGAYNECSNGHTSLDAANSRVTDFVVLPCNGVTSFGPWDISGCADQDGRGWEQLSDNYVTTNFGIRLEDYDQITYLAPPPSAQCSWLAVADYGCMAQPNNPYICRIWAHGEGWSAVAMYFHELGHHFYLSHAGQVNQAGALVEYLDTSCTMGFCCALRCYNAPHTWQMGWLPLLELDEARLTPGTTFSFELTRQAGGKGVRVTPSWVPGAVPFFLSYRDTLGYDKDLAGTPYGANTNIYQSAIATPTGGGATQWLGAIGDTMPALTEGTTGLTFRHLGRAGAAVKVSICRYGGPETLSSCCYGRDNDCNGLGGQSDPACAPFMGSCASFKYNWDLGTTYANPVKPSRVFSSSLNATTPSPNTPPTARAS
ncbi:hypothetical protein N2152v2_001101 [Parachlorella kessleri]